jgi:non-ribosomal peptide synthetase component F
MPPFRSPRASTPRRSSSTDISTKVGAAARRFRYAGRRVTYQEVGERANRLGNALRSRGVDMEQRVFLALPDCPEFAEAFWGAMKIGAGAGSGGRRAPFRGLRVPDQRQPGARGRLRAMRWRRRSSPRGRTARSSR